MSWKPKYLVNARSGQRIMLSGCRPSTSRPSHSTRYGAERFSASELPSKVDLREFMTRVEDQAECNSCTANAIAGAYEYLLKRHAEQELDISRLFVYYNARELDGIRGDQGSSIVTAIESLYEYGACGEELWPYTPKRVNRQPDDRAYEDALQLVLDDAAELPCELRAMKHCLAEGYPFVFGLSLFESFDRATRSGRVPLPDRRERGRGSHGLHAMLAVGYSDKNKSFVVRNSWGEGWGHRGYCYIPYQYMLNPEYCSDLWAVRALSEPDEDEYGWDDDGGFFDEDDDSFEGQESLLDEYEVRDYEDEDGEEGGLISSLVSFFFGADVAGEVDEEVDAEDEDWEEEGEEEEEWDEDEDEGDEDEEWEEGEEEEEEEWDEDEGDEEDEEEWDEDEDEDEDWDEEDEDGEEYDEDAEEDEDEDWDDEDDEDDEDEEDEEEDAW